MTGFIIGKAMYREYDRLYTIYTREQGKMGVMAQGVRKLSSKLAGHLELFHKAVFTIAKGKQRDRIATIDVLERYEPIKESFEKTTAALSCLEIFHQCVKWEDRDRGIYHLLEDFFSSLAIVPCSKSTISAKLFVCRLGSLLGYLPLAGDQDSILSTARSIPQQKQIHVHRSAIHFLEHQLDAAPRSMFFFRSFGQSALDSGRGK